MCLGSPQAGPAGAVRAEENFPCQQFQGWAEQSLGKGTAARNASRSESPCHGSEWPATTGAVLSVLVSCWRGLVAPAGVSPRPCTGGRLWSHSQPQARPWGLCPPVQAECPAQPPQPFRAASCTGKVFERRSLSCSLCPRKSKLEFDAAPLERRRSLRKRIPEQPRWRRGGFQCFVTVGFPYKATQVCFSPDQALSPQRWSDMTLMVPAQPHPCRALPGKRSHEFSEVVECGKRSPSTGQVWAVLTATFSVIEKGSLNKN